MQKIKNPLKKQVNTEIEIWYKNSYFKMMQHSQQSSVQLVNYIANYATNILKGFANLYSLKNMMVKISKVHLFTLDKKPYIET
jgi:hypothetical protein